MDTNQNGGTAAPTSQPIVDDVHFVDTDGSRLVIAGKLHVACAGCGASAFKATLLLDGEVDATFTPVTSATSPLDISQTAIERSKFSPITNRYQWKIQACQVEGARSLLCSRELQKYWGKTTCGFFCNTARRCCGTYTTWR